MDHIYSFSGEDAARYGVPAAIILHHVRWWVAKNRANGRHFHEGRTWTYNSRKAFSELFPFFSPDQIWRAVDKLVVAGVLLKGNFNETAYDRTSWYALGDEDTGETPIVRNRTMDCAKSHNGLREIAQPIPGIKTDIQHTPSGGGGSGFGLKEEKDTGGTTQFDKDAAGCLEAAVRTQPPRTTGITMARPSSWATHFRLLRVQDGFSEDEILLTLTWYATNIGKAFVPQAYSGESFRKKFRSILKQAERDVTLQVTPSAATLALVSHCGYKDDGGRLAVAAQVVSDRYSAWLTKMRAFEAAASKDNLIHEYDTATRNRVARAVSALLGYMPRTYAREWVTRTLDRVRKWKDWNGDFTQFLLDTESQDFQDQCVRALTQYVGQRAQAAWTEITTMMKNEGN